MGYILSKKNIGQEIQAALLNGKYIREEDFKTEFKNKLMSSNSYYKQIQKALKKLEEYAKNENINQFYEQQQYIKNILIGGTGKKDDRVRPKIMFLGKMSYSSQFKKSITYKVEDEIELLNLKNGKIIDENITEYLNSVVQEHQRKFRMELDESTDKKVQKAIKEVYGNVSSMSKKEFNITKARAGFQYKYTHNNQPSVGMYIYGQLDKNNYFKLDDFTSAQIGQMADSFLSHFGVHHQGTKLNSLESNNSIKEEEKQLNNLYGYILRLYNGTNSVGWAHGEDLVLSDSNGNPICNIQLKTSFNHYGVDQGHYQSQQKTEIIKNLLGFKNFDDIEAFVDLFQKIAYSNVLIPLSENIKDEVDNSVDNMLKELTQE